MYLCKIKGKEYICYSGERRIVLHLLLLCSVAIAGVLFSVASSLVLLRLFFRCSVFFFAVEARWLFSGSLFLVSSVCGGCGC